MLTAAQQKANAKAFVARWKAAEGNEDREARSFWIQFAEELLGIHNATYVLDFERRVKGRKIDVFYEDMHVLIENKSRGCSLDERYERSKKVGLETPYEQARWYADNLPYSIRPRWIITCNFDEIRIHDLDKENPGSAFTSVTLDELPDTLYLFGFFTDKSNSRIEKEKQLSVKAGELVGKLYDELAKQYQNIDIDEHEQRSLNVLCVRLVFLLYAEDAGLLAKRGQFYDYLRAVPPSRMRQALIDLFAVLDTPENERDPYLEPELLAFPYINGGLFTNEDIVIPQLTDQIKVDLLAEASAGFDWKDISPTIFGAAFESTLNPETRRAGGMHYTSPENIHKVIDPLFLDDLKAELAEIEGEKVEMKRKQKLRTFQRKLASLTFLDPAAGSHNFLTETYLSLRKLELRIIEDLQGEQTSFDLIDNPIMVNIGQFYAIEINDFAVSVGKTALWIAEQQMMARTQELLPYQEFDFLPLKSITNSVCANALRIDWNEVLPAEKCHYCFGNPPFLGGMTMSANQKDDMGIVFSGLRGFGELDYVCAWYAKAGSYITAAGRCAFVSTNSICQGLSVGVFWKHMKETLGCDIDFAHKTFVWNSEATSVAHVHVIVVGFSKKRSTKKIIYNEDGEMRSVDNINGYLADMQDVYILESSIPLSNVPKMHFGSMPRAKGFTLTPEEREHFLAEDPKCEKWIRPYWGAEEFLKGKERYCLWLVDATLQEITECPLVAERVDQVRRERLSSKAAATRKLAATPTLFAQIAQPAGEHYLLVPGVSSESRDYIPIAFVSSEVIASNLAFLVPNASMYHFGVMSSRFHNTWVRLVAGRMKSDYRYSKDLVYNTFIWPSPTSQQIDNIEKCSNLILDTRRQYPGHKIGDLYRRDKMPSDLLLAHEMLNEAVECAYGTSFGSDEDGIARYLLEMYSSHGNE